VISNGKRMHSFKNFSLYPRRKDFREPDIRDGKIFDVFFQRIPVDLIHKDENGALFLFGS